MRTAQRVLVAAIVGSALFAASAALPNAGLRDRAQIGDTSLYRRYGDAFLEGQIPYRDYYMEYPPGALAAFAAPAPGNDSGYPTRFKLLALALGIVLVGVVAATLAVLGASTRRLAGAVALVGVSPAALGPVVLVNYDLWPALLATAAVSALVFGRDRLAFGALGAAVAAKFYPLVLLPVALVHVWTRGGRPALRGAALAFAAALAAIVLPFAVLAPTGLVYDLSGTLRRPLQVESLGASFLLAAHQLDVYSATVTNEFNSYTLDGLLPDAVAALMSLLVVVAIVAVWRAYADGPAAAERLLVAAAASLAGAVAFGKVLSPQFLVWLVPAIALVGGRGRLVPYGLLIAALVLTQLWFPSRYGEVLALGPVSWVVLARNLVLVALFVVLLRRLRPARGT